jgi:hypothetical protein
MFRKCGETWGTRTPLAQLVLDCRPIGLYDYGNKFALTFIRWADLNFMQSG